MIANELRRTDKFHQLIKPETLNNKEMTQLYINLISDEFREALDSKSFTQYVKELCDIIVTLRAGLMYDYRPHMINLYRSLEQMLLMRMERDGINAEYAMKAVNDSNYSKLFREEDIAETMAHFLEMGVEVNVNELGDGYFGVFSAKNQTVNGKEYRANKLLKPHTYRDVDESTEFWK